MTLIQFHDVEIDSVDQIYKICTHLQMNNILDAWGIVVSPKVFHKLRAECMERIVVHNADAGVFETIFGLRVIPYASVSDKTCYVVNEQLGRTLILG